MTTIGFGQTYTVSAFQAVLDTTVTNGGTLVVEFGGESLATTVSSGGVISNAGSDYNTTLNGGFEQVMSGGLTSGLVVNGGLVDVASGGVGSAVIVESGGVATVEYGATIVGETILWGLESIYGVSISAILDSPAADVSVRGPSALVSNATLKAGELDLYEGATAIGTVVSHGASLGIILSGTDIGATVAGLEDVVGVSESSTVVAGGLQLVDGFTDNGQTYVGSSFGAYVSGKKAEELVGSGGTAVDTTVASGGTLELGYLSGGVATGSLILKGGAEIVSAAGVGVGETIDLGGKITVLKGGTTIFDTIRGVMSVKSGGLASATTVSKGGALTVSSGGEILGGVNLAGGKATLAGVTAAGQTISMTATGASLALVSAASFQGEISGFAKGDRIDVGGVAYSASEKVAFTPAAGGTSGTLTLTPAAGPVDSLTLVGSYVSGNFKLATDGKGGTIVEFQTPPATAAVGFAQAMASLTVGGGTLVGGPATSAGLTPLIAAGR